jgi:hypothetical protein
VVVVVGITTAPAAAEPQAAGEAEFTAQLELVEYVAEVTPVNVGEPDPVQLIPNTPVANEAVQPAVKFRVIFPVFVPTAVPLFCNVTRGNPATP